MTLAQAKVNQLNICLAVLLLLLQRWWWWWGDLGGTHGAAAEADAEASFMFYIYRLRRRRRFRRRRRRERARRWIFFISSRAASSPSRSAVPAYKEGRETRAPVTAALTSQ